MSSTRKLHIFVTACYEQMVVNHLEWLGILVSKDLNDYGHITIAELMTTVYTKKDLYTLDKKRRFITKELIEYSESILDNYYKSRTICITTYGMWRKNKNTCGGDLMYKVGEHDNSEQKTQTKDNEQPFDHGLSYSEHDSDNVDCEEEEDEIKWLSFTKSSNDEIMWVVEEKCF